MWGDFVVNDSEKRRNNSKNEQLIMLASTLITLQISEGKTADEIELIALILENVTVQLATISDMRDINDGTNNGTIFPII